MFTQKNECKRLTALWLLLCLVAVLPLHAQEELLQKLRQIGSISQIDTLPGSQWYPKKYVMRFTQPLDHQHPEKGSFTQRLVLCHAGFDRPTVMETEGYDAEWNTMPNYWEEPSLLLRANLLVVEHRYFAESMPEQRDWQYLTAANSAHDLHAINTAFRTVYPGKWIASGISKGGQTTLLYRTYYPDDVDISIPYVAPLCFSDQDRRPEEFLRRVGTDEERSRILTFQREVLKRRTAIQPLMERYCNQKQYTFRIPMAEVLDFCVLEYPFSLWQWGTPIDSVPAATATDEQLARHLIQIVDPDYFRIDHPTLSFFVQAAHELGYYTYDTRPLRDLLTIRTSKDYLHRVMLPEELKGLKFDKSLSRKIRRFLQKNDPRMLFIYGSNDPWTSAGVTYLKDKQNIRVFIGEGGSHATRIRDLSAAQQAEIKQLLEQWLQEAE